MHSWFLALRYLRAHRIVYWSIAAVAIGITAVIVVTSVMGGFARDIRARIRGLRSDLTIQAAAGDLYLRDYEALADRIRTLPHVRGCAPRIETAAWIRATGGRARPVTRERPLYTVIGIDPEREAGASRLPEFFANRKKKFSFAYDDGRPATLAPVVPGRQIIGDDEEDDAQDLGREWMLTTVRDDGGPRLCERGVEIVGTFKSGMAEYDATFVFMPLGEVQRWLGLEATESRPAVVNRMAVSLDDYEAHGSAARSAVIGLLHDVRPCRKPERHAAGICGPWKVETWEESQSILLQAVAVEKSLQMIILFLVVLVAGFNVISIYSLMVKSKTRDIGVIRALGATEGDVGRVFVYCGLLCGLLGSLIGVVGGLAIASNVGSIESFLRVWSREISPGASIGTAILGALSLAALTLWWWKIGDPWKSSKWAWGGAASVLMAAAALGGFAWSGDYRALAADPSIPSSFALRAGLLAFALPVTATIFRRLAEPLEGYLVGGLVHLVVTFLGIAATFMAGLLLAVPAATALVRPTYGWRGFEIFDRGTYYMDRIPAEIDPARVAFIAAATLAICLLFSLHPAARASRLEPLAAIREE